VWIGTTGRGPYGRRKSQWTIPTNEGPYTFRLTATNDYGAITTIRTIYCSKGIPPFAPRWISEPDSVITNVGAVVQFKAQATGAPFPGSRWLSNGIPIPGAAGSNLWFSSVSTNHRANYALVVTNASGTLTSRVATLKVLLPPIVVTQPQSRTNALGSTAIFSVSVTSTEPVTYRWLRNGTPLTDGGQFSGTAGPALVMTNVQLGDAVGYSVVINHAYGAVTSQVAALTVVLMPPEIVVQPHGARTYVGGAATLDVQAGGSAPLRYLWFHDGSAVTNGGRFSGATSFSLSIADVELADAGAYTVTVSNSIGSALSSSATLVVGSIHLDQVSRLGNGNVQFAVTGLPGDVYRVEGGTNFVAWRVLGFATNSNGSIQFADSNAPVLNLRFYRAGLVQTLPAFLVPARNTAGVTQLTVLGSNGGVYRIQASSNLVAWDTLATVTNINGVAEFTNHSPADLNRWFYRLVTP
jgi:hypothetical protein